MTFLSMQRAASPAMWDKYVTKIGIHLGIRGFLLDVEKYIQAGNRSKVEEVIPPEGLKATSA